MKTRFNHLKMIVCGLAVALLAVGTTSAAKRQAFDSTYSLSEVQEAADEVSLQLTVSLTNRSGGEVHYGVLRILRDEGAPEPVEPYAQFGHISLPLAGTVELSTYLLLGTAEYEEWSGGSPLSAELKCTDENGVQQTATLSLRHQSEEPEN